MKKKLKQILSQEDTVLFIGSGISMWSGLPSWSRLVEDLAMFVEASGSNADLVRIEARNGDLLQAASYGFHKLTKSQIGDFIRKACMYGKAKPHLIHQKIVTLGPRCFITTNYDHLIEESLRNWRNEFSFQTVTNRQLTETAGVVASRATDFVFKPHGDAADSESIILTREQYRDLLPGGENHAALESVKMLMASRPVIYIGFGLRDLDFIYLRDLLSNTYKGGIRDHYAIMADVSETEIDYWRSHYGIHLATYATTERIDSSRDHSALLTFLDELLVKAPSPPVHDYLPNAQTPCSTDIILSLARYAAKLARIQKQDPEFPIRVHPETRRGDKGFREPLFDKFNHYPVEKFLEKGPNRALLIGLPGAGKSYSLQRAAACMAEKLHENCLGDSFQETTVVIPLFIDLKLYRGDLYDLANQTLPTGLTLDWLAQRFKVKLFIDSFNEMPREYWESTSYEVDFANFISRVETASIIIGSRTNDGLTKLEFAPYHLDQIDAKFVTSELKRLKISVNGRFHAEVCSLLQKPFYFHLLVSKAVTLPLEAHPRDFYQSFFAGLTDSFQIRFGSHFDLTSALSIIAYRAINSGEEAQPIAAVLQALKVQLEANGLYAIDSIDVANWLVSKAVIIPYSGARIAFFHQSATEYLAASELARLYQDAPQLLKEKLLLTRWDQALFLTLSLLPKSATDVFLKTVIEADFALALNAAKYIEDGRDEVISKLLCQIPERLKHRTDLYHKVAWMLQSVVPISENNETQLRTIMNLGDSIGGAAAQRLVELKGSAVKGELIELLLDHKEDFNFCVNGIGDALAPLATFDDIKKITELADKIGHEVTADFDDEVAHGFIAGSAKFLAGVDVLAIENGFLTGDESTPVPEVRARILCNFLWDNHSTAALNLAAQLLLRGVRETATAIYFIASYPRPDDQLSWKSFSRRHIELLLSQLDDEDDESWTVRAIGCICNSRPDLSEFVKSIAANSSGIKKAILSYCASENDLNIIFEALITYAEMDLDQRKKEPINLLGQVDFNWSGQEPLLVRLLRLTDTDLAVSLIGHLRSEDKVGELEVGKIDWCLQWLADHDHEDDWLFIDRFSSLLANHTNLETQKSFIREFNKPDSKFRHILCSIFISRQDLGIDEFSEDAISFMIADLSQGRSVTDFRGHLIGQIATEQFVRERLLPLLANAEGRFLTRLRKVIIQAGSRHGRRYIAE